MASTAAIRVFGPLSVLLNGRHVDLGPPRQRAVLAVLLTAIGRVVPVQTIMDGLWGSEPPEQALASLHSYVSRLRKPISSWPLSDGARLEIQYRSPGYLLVAPPDEIDTARFEQLVHEGLEAARGANQAQAFSVLGSALDFWTAPPFEEFAEYSFASQEVLRLQKIRLTAIEQRAEAAFALGRDADVLPELESEVDRNPLEERLVSLLMRAQYRTARQADALRTFERTRHLLAEELGVDASPQLQRMHCSILRHDPSLHLPEEEHARSKAEPEIVTCAAAEWEPETMPIERKFLGRRRELGRLLATASATRSGSGRTTVVVGEAGIGKTALLQRFTSMVGTVSDVITVQCPDAPGMPPYWPWARILRQALRSRPALTRSLSPETRRTLAQLVREFCPDSAGASPPDRDAPFAFALHDAITEALEILSHRPVVLVLENFQWADTSSWDFLRFLGGQLTRMRLHLVVSFRSFLVSHVPVLRATVAALLQQPGSELLRLEGLDQAETADLAATVLRESRAPDDEVSKALCERAEGNPYFILELARNFSHGTTPDDVPEMIPDSIREVILERLGAVPQEVRSVLDMCSVLEEGSDPAVLARMVGQAGLTSEALRAARRGDLLRVETGKQESIRFKHSLVRDVVRQELSEESVAEIHRRAVRSLVSQSPDPDSFAAPVAAHAGAALHRLPAENVLVPLIAEADRLAQGFAYGDALRCLALASSLIEDHSHDPNYLAFQLELLTRQGELSAVVHGAGAPATVAVHDRIDHIVRRLHGPLRWPVTMGDSTGQAGADHR